MLRNTYRAKVRDNIIYWAEGVPPDLQSEGDHDVLVIVPETNQASLARSRKAVEILEQLSKLDPFRDIEDPVEWQREIRKDRPLPGRE